MVYGFADYVVLRRSLLLSVNGFFSNAFQLYKKRAAVNFLKAFAIFELEHQAIN